MIPEHIGYADTRFQIMLELVYFIGYQHYSITLKYYIVDAILNINIDVTIYSIINVHTWSKLIEKKYINHREFLATGFTRVWGCIS